jgi:hypothetical protein
MATASVGRKIDKFSVEESRNYSIVQDKASRISIDRGRGMF